MKFLFKKIICLSVAWAGLVFAQVDLEKKEILDQAEKSVYRVETITMINGRLSSMGSGFFISEDLFVTNLHVVETATGIQQITLLPKEDRFSPIKIKSIEYVSMYADLAILRTETKSPYFLKQGEISLNEKLTFIGYPKGHFIRAESEGFAIPSPQPYNPLYSIQFENEESLRSGGMSGGPLLNSKGEFVGVVSQAKISNTESVPYFISSEFVDKLFNEELGQKCLNFLCVEKEYQMVQEHIERYAYNTEELPLDSSFFHLATNLIFRLGSHKDTVLSYLVRVAAQEEELYLPFIQKLNFLIRKRIIDMDTYLDWIHAAGEQGNSIVQRRLFDMYTKGGMGVEKDVNQALYWRQKLSE